MTLKNLESRCLKEGKTIRFKRYGDIYLEVRFV